MRQVECQLRRRGIKSFTRGKNIIGKRMTHAVSNVTFIYRFAEFIITFFNALNVKRFLLKPKNILIIVKLSKVLECIFCGSPKLLFKFVQNHITIAFSNSKFLRYFFIKVFK